MGSTTQGWYKAIVDGAIFQGDRKTGQGEESWFAIVKARCCMAALSAVVEGVQEAEVDVPGWWACPYG